MSPLGVPPSKTTQRVLVDTDRVRVSFRHVGPDQSMGRFGAKGLIA